eukprot:1188575-Prorocentrum_minimum.AAC.4
MATTVQTKSVLRLDVAAQSASSTRLRTRAVCNAAAKNNVNSLKRATFSTGAGLKNYRSQTREGPRSRQMVVRAVEADAETSLADGRPTYSPQTFEQLVGDAVVSVKQALKDNVKQMEVEFPLSSDTSGWKRKNPPHVRVISGSSLFGFEKQA